jgi:hypothetical protein
MRSSLIPPLKGD